MDVDSAVDKVLLDSKDVVVAASRVEEDSEDENVVVGSGADVESTDDKVLVERDVDEVVRKPYL